MKILILILLVVPVLTMGCSTKNNVKSDELWDYKDGFVVAKEDGRVLVVRNKVDNPNEPLNEILENALPDAIWVQVDKSDFASVMIGDEVSISFPDGVGLINQSYPLQTKANVARK
ncbi:hypothetical protein J2T17_007152 [Paenibacillus mucilaginosus]|uniref:DUF3221 domain-containing protein n=1 Tax=Paenibacillus mucilaginosus TaxID=61624 RepID=UPI003D1CE95C